MNRFQNFIVSLVTLLLLGLLSPGTSPAGRLTLQEKRGKEIYLRGRSTSNQKITANLVTARVQMPATAMPCASCHGLDGRGKSEGGVIPSNITWEALTKPGGIRHPNRREYPPYTDHLLDRAITRGLDPAGNPLAFVMPRYGMSREDLVALRTYLKRLGKNQDPGVTETRIRVGTILPAKGPLAPMGQAMQAVMLAYFDEINAQGGIHNRRIELQAAKSADRASATRRNAAQLLEEEPVFAMVGAFLNGAGNELVALIEEEEVPLVGPLTRFPLVPSPPNRHLFYLYSGLEDQARVLVDFAAQTLPTRNPHVAILSPEHERLVNVREAIEVQGKKAGWNSVTTFRYPPGRFDAGQFATQLSREGADAVFFLGSGGEASALMKEAEKLPWTPTIFLPGSLVGTGIFDSPVRFTKKIFLSFPSLPSDHTRTGVMEYRVLAEKHQLPARHLRAQVLAYCAAKILVKGLEQAGKDLSREGLIMALEGLYEFDTGLTPPITYGPDRRIGALGAYVVGIDLEKKAFVSLSKWITPQ
jgi:ABC-type branched-subunit amino acid transport system substrate-binding protein